ncbi:prenyltransferase, partial [Streptomyces kunmingensis]|nr:prenyltransferase [Streptomyces kunmingensis]
RTPGMLSAALAATVWAYDLGLKRTPAGPAAMGAARGLDVLMGAAASHHAGHPDGATPPDRTAPLRAAAPSALTLATHTAAVTTVSRNETTGGTPAAPAAALLTTAVLTRHLLRLPAGRGAAAPLGLSGPTAYAATTLRPLLHATLNPSPPLTQRAVGAGIRAMIPLQAALAARAGAPRTALATAALAPLARRFAKKVSVT